WSPNQPTKKTSFKRQLLLSTRLLFNLNKGVNFELTARINYGHKISRLIKLNMKFFTKFFILNVEILVKKDLDFLKCTYVQKSKSEFEISGESVRKCLKIRQKYDIIAIRLSVSILETRIRQKYDISARKNQLVCSSECKSRQKDYAKFFRKIYEILQNLRCHNQTKIKHHTSSGPIERTFSYAGYINRPHRSRMTVKNLENTTLLRYLIK
ncbi:hypothetical protein BpHYR1_007150, partial [Brachionus plicatilis]